MDSLRSILMMLGVVLHSAVIFDPLENWLIASPITADYSDYIVKGIHTFRMPAFFVISGYFCVLTLSRYKVRKFITLRLARITIPFFTTAITLNSLQTLLLDSTGWRVLEIETYLLEGGWISHLWFLVNIMVYFTVAVILFSLFQGSISRLGKILAKIFQLTPVIFIVCLFPLFSLGIHAFGYFGFNLNFAFLGFLNAYELLIYAPYFIVGCVLAMEKDLIIRFSSVNPLLSLSLLIGFFVYLQYLPLTNNSLLKAFEIYIQLLSTWVATLLSFALAYLYLNLDSKIWRFLSDSSYTVYLFHHIFVVTLGIGFISLNIIPSIGIVLLILISLASTLMIHKFLITRYSVLSYLFNGKR